MCIFFLQPCFQVITCQNKYILKKRHLMIWKPELLGSCLLTKRKIILISVSFVLIFLPATIVSFVRDMKILHFCKWNGNIVLLQCPCLSQSVCYFGDYTSFVKDKKLAPSMTPEKMEYDFQLYMIYYQLVIKLQII